MSRSVVESSEESKDMDRNGESETMDLSFVTDLLLKEVQIPTLQQLPPDTYKTIAKFIRIESLRSYESIESKIRDELIRLIGLATKLLIEIRCQKLACYKVNEGTLLPYALATEEYSKLTEEEKYILEGNLDAFRKKESIMLASSEGREKMLKTISQLVHSKKVIVRFLRPIEQFMGVDMTKYGPFVEEDVAILPFENARSLLETGTAAEIHDDVPGK
jgi:DNA replication factor GINS